MSKMKLQQILDYEGINRIDIENNLAPLSIEASPHGKVELIGELDLVQPYEEFTWEDCVSSSFSAGILKIVLDEVEGIEPRYFSSNRSFIKILVPEKITLVIELENLPVSVSGIDNKLNVTSENGPIRIQDCGGNKELTNENGPISLINCAGSLSISLENGPLAAENICGDKLKIESENGPLKIREACYPKVNIQNENGVIVFETLAVEDAEITLTNENGVIHFVMPDDMDFILTAETETGQIKSNLSSPVEENDDKFIIKNGEGRTKINISTENGIIKIGAGERINLEFLKAKLEQLKKTLSEVGNSEDMEKAKKLFASVNEYVSARISGISEEGIKDVINANLDKLKRVIDDFDFKETKDKTLSSVEELSGKIYEDLHKSFEKLGSHFSEKIHVGKHKHGFSVDGLGDYINKVINSSLIKPYLGGEMKDKEKSEVSDRSRIKILEMLETGKITAEEAERLLKAIGKE